MHAVLATAQATGVGAFASVLYFCPSSRMSRARPHTAWGDTAADWTHGARRTRMSCTEVVKGDRHGHRQRKLLGRRPQP
jgi:hypothetical protein